jgi:hypothetical protein
MSANFDFDVRISAELLNQLHEGGITPSMLLTMTCLYNWADWGTGRVKNASAGGLHTWTLKAYSERTFSEALRKLEWMGWITRHMKRGSHRSYAVTIHNYKVMDDAGKVQVINPKNITIWEEFPSGRCEEGSDETSDEGSDETSDRTSLKSSLKPNLKSSLKNEGLVIQSASQTSDSSLRSSSCLTTTSKITPDQTVVLKQEQPLTPYELKKQSEAKVLADALGESSELPNLLGMPYMFADDNPAMLRIVTVLRERNRTIDWLVEMVRWIKAAKTRESKFWSKCVHTGSRAVGQLAKHLEKGELCQQFDSHLVVKHDSPVESPNLVYALRPLMTPQELEQELATAKTEALPPTSEDDEDSEEGNPDDVEFESKEGDPNDVEFVNAE